MKRIFEFRILHDGWETDNAGWITEDENGRKLYTTGHGREYEMTRFDISDLIQRTEENLARLKEAAGLMGYATDQTDAAINDPLYGLEATQRRAEQLGVNCRWLIDKIDRIHASLCPGSSGTWQQRAEHAVKHALEVECQRTLTEKPALCGARGMAGGGGCKLPEGHAGGHKY